jgi:hypothetical protein
MTSSKDWPPALLSITQSLMLRIKALDMGRNDHRIYHKVEDWFKLTGEQLRDQDILPENVYNIDEIDRLLERHSSTSATISGDLMHHGPSTSGLFHDSNFARVFAEEMNMFPDPS